MAMQRGRPKGKKGNNISYVDVVDVDLDEERREINEVQRFRRISYSVFFLSPICETKRTSLDERYMYSTYK